MASAAGAGRWALSFSAERASDLMTPSVVSVHGSATLADALRVMTDRAVSAVAVINEAGRPVGVLSRTDILVHERESRARGGGAQPGAIRVSDLMTPAVFTVPPHMPGRDVVRHL